MSCHVMSCHQTIINAGVRSLSERLSVIDVCYTQVCRRWGASHVHRVCAKLWRHDFPSKGTGPCHYQHRKQVRVHQWSTKCCANIHHIVFFSQCYNKQQTNNDKINVTTLQTAWQKTKPVLAFLSFVSCPFVLVSIDSALASRLKCNTTATTPSDFWLTTSRTT